MNDPGAPWAQYAPLLVIAVVLALRARRMNRLRPFRPHRAWLVVGLYTLLVGAILFVRPPDLAGWGLFAAGLALGSALGWHYARLTRLERGDDGGILARQSPVAVLLIGVVMVLRLFMRAEFAGPGTDPGQMLLMTDALLGFALGFLTLQRIELVIRARSP